MIKFILKPVGDMFLAALGVIMSLMLCAPVLVLLLVIAAVADTFMKQGFLQ